MIQLVLYMSETVFFLFISICLGIYLYNILGQENDEDDEKIRDKCKCVSEMFEDAKDDKSKACDDDIVVEAMEVVEDEDLHNKILEIRKILGDFDPDDFKDKAAKAFEVACNAYIEVDRSTMKTLLAKNVYELFNENLSKLEKDSRHVENIIFRTVSIKFYAIQINEKNISIAMHIISEQCNVIKDKDDNIVSGSNDHIVTHDEIWTFTKERKSLGKVWLVSDIRVTNA